MPFDPETEPLAALSDLNQESRFTHQERFNAAWFHFHISQFPNFTLPLESGRPGRIEIRHVASRNALHIHAPQAGNRRAIDYVVNATDAWSWCQQLAKELWDKGYFRMP